MRLPDSATLINIVTICLLVFGLPRYLRAKSTQGRLAEKDQAIQTHEQTINALTGRIEALEADVNDCRRVAQDSSIEAKTWKARYEEQARYTAEPALVEVRDSIRALEATTATALSSLGELVMQSNALLARLDPKP